MSNNLLTKRREDDIQACLVTLKEESMITIDFDEDHIFRQGATCGIARNSSRSRGGEQFVVHDGSDYLQMKITEPDR